MTTAQSRVADLARWIDASSGPRRTPLGGDTEVGRYAVIVPCDFDEPPPIEGDPDCLLLFVSAEQAEGVATGPIVTDAPASQDHVRERLAHILWKIGTDLAPMAVVGLDSPDEAISGAVERAGAAGVNKGAYPVVAVPLWAFSAADRPYLPRIALQPKHIGSQSNPNRCETGQPVTKGKQVGSVCLKFEGVEFACHAALVPFIARTRESAHRDH